MSGRAGSGGLEAWVRRFSVDETRRHPGGFTLYKITSVLFPLASPEAVTVVCVWKRYSETQRLQRNMKSLHTALHLPGTVPTFAKWSYFRRLDAAVVEERRTTTARLLAFIAEHRLLFTSAEFVNFLQSGHPEPAAVGTGVIDCIRSELHLPPEVTPPLEYPTSDEDVQPLAPVRPTEPTSQQSPPPPGVTMEPDDKRDEDTILDVSEIKVFEAADVEFKTTPKKRGTITDSFESLSSWGSGSSDFFDEIDQISTSTIPKSRSALPDLITFDVRNAPSTSRRHFDDYHTMDEHRDLANNNAAVSEPSLHPSETVSISSTLYDSSVNGNDSLKTDRSYKRSMSQLSTYSGQSSVASCEHNYVFEAGYTLSLGARCEDMGEYARAFECYNAGIEKMLVGVHSDPDPTRRAIIKEKTNKYLAYAENIYRNYLANTPRELLDPEPMSESCARAAALPAAMLRRPYEELALYRVLRVLPPACMLLLHKELQHCYTMKVIQKIPNNLTEFDDYFSQKANETRTPILPTNVPYMVRLHGYVETPNLLFLLLDYAPGGKLLDYIDNYVKSVPNTPAREVNLENVFSEPVNRSNSTIPKDNNKELDTNLSISDKIEYHPSNRHKNNVGLSMNDETGWNTSEIIESPIKTELVSNNDQSDINICFNDMVISEKDLSVNELVINSQRLLLNVDSALSDTDRSHDVVDRVNIEKDINKSDVTLKVKKTKELELVKLDSEKEVKSGGAGSAGRGRDALPPATVRSWAAELLLAIEHLHNAGVVCRQLKPHKLLLGERGQLLLTYAYGRPRGAALASLAPASEPDLYAAPELYGDVCAPAAPEDNACDYWSYGAILYLLICGRPLSYYHNTVFTSHTTLQLPEGLPLDVDSLLTQLLMWDPRTRLGARGADEVRSHPYFRDVRWDELRDAWRPPASPHAWHHATSASSTPPHPYTPR